MVLDQVSLVEFLVVPFDNSTPPLVASSLKDEPQRVGDPLSFVLRNEGDMMLEVLPRVI